MSSGESSSPKVFGKKGSDPVTKLAWLGEMPREGQNLQDLIILLQDPANLLEVQTLEAASIAVG